MSDEEDIPIVYLAVGEDLPGVPGSNQPWLLVEAGDNSLFYGTGESWKPNGEWVGYDSLAEDDLTLDAAIAAARAWARKYGVPAVWVRREPWSY